MKKNDEEFYFRSEKEYFKDEVKKIFNDYKSMLDKIKGKDAKIKFIEEEKRRIWSLKEKYEKDNKETCPEMMELYNKFIAVRYLSWNF